MTRPSAGAASCKLAIFVGLTASAISRAKSTAGTSLATSMSPSRRTSTTSTSRSDCPCKASFGPSSSQVRLSERPNTKRSIKRGERVNIFIL